MAISTPRLLWFTTLCLLGSGCSLHVVSGPVSQQGAEQRYYYAMGPERVQAFAPMTRPRSESPTSRRAARPRRAVARRDTLRSPALHPLSVESTTPDAGAAESASAAGHRLSPRERRRRADATSFAENSAGSDSKKSKPRDARADDPRQVRPPFWASVDGQGRIDLQGTLDGRSDGKRGEPKALR